MKTHGAASMAIAVVALAASLSVTAADGHLDRGINVEPNKEQKGLDLTLDIRKREGSKSVTVTDPQSRGNGQTFKVGDLVVICFKTNRKGFASVWSLDAAGSPSLIFPNDFTEGGKSVRGVPVEGGKEYCIGEENFQLRVDKPLGESKAYVQWSPTIAGQLPADAYPVIGGVSKGGSEGQKAETASRTATFNIAQ